MFVVLDTNALVGDWKLRSVSFQALLTASEAQRLAVAVPEVVVLELINKHRESLLAAEAERDAAQRRLHELLIEEPEESRRDALADANERYAALLRARLQQARAKVLPIPDVPHEELLTRALARNKPFNSKTGAGYRDALIWESVLRAAAQLGDVTFITADGDFASNEDRQTLDETLRAEALGRGVIVELERSLHRYVQVNIESVQAALDLLRKRAADDELFVETTQAWMRAAVSEGVAARQNIELEIPRLESVNVDELVRIDKLEFDYVFPVGNERVSFELMALCGVEITVEGYEPSESERQDWDPVGWAEYGDATLTFEGVADKASGDLVELQWSAISYG
jgi:hypothetical protein